jgi:hypothetical protein
MQGKKYHHGGTRCAIARWWCKPAEMNSSTGTRQTGPGARLHRLYLRQMHRAPRDNPKAARCAIPATSSFAKTDLTTLSDDVRRFILNGVPSVAHLEAILLLRSAPAERWTPARVAQRLYIRDGDAAELLQGLVESRVARADEDEGYGYGPSDELRQLIDALAAAYAADLVGVTELIHSRSSRRAQQFADAFRIKKTGGGT